MHQSKYLAIVDLGSNSFNLIIAKREPLFFTIIKRFNITVQLARYLDEQGNISQEGIDKCVKSLEILNEHLKIFAHSIEVRANATYTIRRAENRDELLKAAFAAFPYKINVISGEQEALNIFKGISLSYPILEKFIALDIGGGSTEIIFSEDLKPQFCTSQNLGCVSFSKEFFTDGVISPEAYDRALARALEFFQPLTFKAKELGFYGVETAVGSSGTVKTCLSLIKNQFQETERHLIQIVESTGVDPEELKIAQGLIPLIRKFAERTKNNFIDLPSIELLASMIKQYSSTKTLIKHGFDLNGREVLIGGLAILHGLFLAFGFQRLHYSDTALREGVLYADFSEQEIYNIRSAVIADLRRKYNIDDNLVEDFSKQLYAISVANFLPFSKHEIIDFSLFTLFGLYIGEEKFVRNSLYIMKNTALYGFSEDEKTNLENFLNNQVNPSLNKGSSNICKLALGAYLTNHFIGTNIYKYVADKQLTINLLNSYTAEFIIPQALLDQDPNVDLILKRLIVKSPANILNLTIKVTD